MLLVRGIVARAERKLRFIDSSRGTESSNPALSANEAVRNVGLVSLGRVEYTTCICKLEFLLS